MAPPTWHNICDNEVSEITWIDCILQNCEVFVFPLDIQVSHLLQSFAYAGQQQRHACICFFNIPVTA